MVAQSKADPLACAVATPGWYFGFLQAQAWVMTQAEKFRWPLLVLAGQADPVADPATARDFYERAASAAKRFIAYDGLLHELLREKERQKIFADILAWLAERAAANGWPAGSPVRRPPGAEGVP